MTLDFINVGYGDAILIRSGSFTMLVDCGTRVYPVGRLDMDSEGLLILTNDGDFANKMLHPAHEVEKIYEVWVKCKPARH